MVLDPENKVLESDETNNVASLPLHREAEILSGAVHQQRVGGVTLELYFLPGSGSGDTISLSEAEVALGVDHFNWLQWVTDLPSGWQPQTVFFDPSRFDPTVPWVASADGTIYYLNGQGDPVSVAPVAVDQRGFFYYKDDLSVVRPETRVTPFLDPIVALTPGATRVFWIDANQDGVQDGVIAWPITADKHPYYLDDPDEVRSFGELDPFTFFFSDTPYQPPLLFSGGSPFQGLGRPAIAFSTTLVGVSYSNPDVGITWTSKGYKLTTEWKSDTVGGTAGTGVFDVISGGKSLGVPENVISGGVFDIVFADTALPLTLSAPVDQDPLADTVQEGSPNGTMVGVTAFSSPPTEDRVVYSLVDDAGGRFAIDPTTGVVTVADGSLLDRSAATEHDIVVRAVSGSFVSVASFTITVTAANDAPVLAPIADVTADEGSSVSFTASATPSSPGRALTYTLDPGAPTAATIDPTTGAFSWVAADGPGDSSITVRVTDTGNPALNDAKTFRVTVNNVAPTATFSNSGPTVYGNPVTVGFGGQFDPSEADTAAGFSYSYSLDGVNFDTPTADVSAQFSLGAGTHALYGRIYDKDGDYSQYSTQVTVEKAAPTVTVFGGSFVYDGTAHPATGLAVTGVGGVSLGTPTVTYYYRDEDGAWLLTGNNGADAPVEPGYYKAVASFAGSDDYFDGSAVAEITIAYAARSLTDLSQALKAGRAIPIKIMLLDAGGNNVSSPDVALTALRLEKVDADGNRTQVAIEDAGNANPDNLFRYDAALGGYVFNLSTKQLGAGTYDFTWTAGDDPTEHHFGFTLE